MGDGSRIERITMVSLLQRGMSMSRTNHVISVDIWERNKELIRKRTDTVEAFTRLKVLSYP